MNLVTAIGAGKFALEVAGYLAEAACPDGQTFAVASFLSIDGEEGVTPEWCTATFDPSSLGDRGKFFVLAVSEPNMRSAIRNQLSADLYGRFPVLVHRTSTVASSATLAPGVLIGPQCHVGTNVGIGAFSVLNYQCGVGHHSRVGAGVFLSPGFQCGNSAAIGDGCFFGLNCIVGPAVTLGSGVYVQAGTTILEDLPEGQLAFSSARTKSIPRSAPWRRVM